MMTGDRQYYVYIMTNHTNSVLYTGITNDLARRVWEHKGEFVRSFTAKYKVNKLVYYEMTSSVDSAIAREKQLKAGSRLRKMELVDAMNPKWLDLGDQLW